MRCVLLWRTLECAANVRGPCRGGPARDGRDARARLDREVQDGARGAVRRVAQDERGRARQGVQDEARREAAAGRVAQGVQGGDGDVCLLRVRRRQDEGGLRLLRRGDWQDDGLLRREGDEGGLVLRSCGRRRWREGRRGQGVRRAVRREAQRRQGRLRLLRVGRAEEGRVRLRHDVSLQVSARARRRPLLVVAKTLHHPDHNSHAPYILFAARALRSPCATTSFAFSCVIASPAAPLSTRTIPRMTSSLLFKSHFA